MLTKPTKERVEFLLSKVTKKSSVLDIGSGGFGSCIPHDKQPIGKTIAEHSGKYLGIERYEEKTATMRSLGIPMEVAMIESSKYVNEFDVVIAGLVILCTEDINAALRAIHKALKPGGVFVCDVPNLWYAPRIVKYILFGRYGLMKDPQNNYTFDYASLQKLLEVHGFKVTENKFLRGRVREKLFPRRFAQFIGVVAEKV